MKFFCPLLFMLLGVPAGAAMRIDLGHGQFVIEADETVDTVRIDSRNYPGVCAQELIAVPVNSARIDVRPATAGCNRDRYAIVRINPTWQSALDLRASAGQIDFAASSMRAMAAVDASVSTGDIFGIPDVKRSWLVGAKAQFDHQRPGMTVTVHVSTGQINFASDSGDTP
jgi:hypothetical protein